MCICWGEPTSLGLIRQCLSNGAAHRRGQYWSSFRKKLRQRDPLPAKAPQRPCAQKGLPMCCKEEYRAGAYLGWGWFKPKRTVGAVEGGELFQGSTASYCTARCNFLLGSKVKFSTNTVSLVCDARICYQTKNKVFLEMYCCVKSVLVLAGSRHWSCDISWEGYFA